MWFVLMEGLNTKDRLRKLGLSRIMGQAVYSAQVKSISLSTNFFCMSFYLEILVCLFSLVESGLVLAKSS